MRINLLVAIILVGLLPVLSLLISILKLYSNGAIDNRAAEVRMYSNVAIDMIIESATEAQSLKVEDDKSEKENSDKDDSENSDEDFESDSILDISDSDLSQMDSIAQIYGGRVLVINSQSQIVKDTNIHTTDLSMTSINYSISSEVTKCLETGIQDEVERANDYYELISPIKDKNGNILGVIVLGYSVANIIDMNDMVEQKSIIILTIVIIVVIFAAYAISKKVSSSVNKIAVSIVKVKDGFMDEIEVVDDFLETKQLSVAINDTFDRVQQLENSRQEFVSNVSHELKTPITSVKVLADSLIAQEEVPAELYREFMIDISDELERENKIINDLLALVKLDKKASKLNIESISINSLLEKLLKRLRPLAAKRDIEITFESFRDVNAEVDELKISLALSNLIENAIKYNNEAGWVKVSLDADHKNFYVKVADSGVGIPEDCQSKLFDRFYRVDKARSRDTGGSGLGLSITRNVIVLHKGAIRVKSKYKEGTTFTLRIPLNYVNDEKNNEQQDNK